MINRDKLRKIEDAYLKYLPDYWNEENYKWKAVKRFNDVWDIDAADFPGMLKKALEKTYNLLTSGYYFANGMLLQFAQEDPEGLRELFRFLYDESKDLAERVDRFHAYADDRKLNHNDSGWKNHYQNNHAISVYLWLRYPNKYYIYKYEEIGSVAAELESDFIPKYGFSAVNLTGCFRLCDEICAQLSKNEAIVETFKNLLTEDCYPDPSFRTLTADFIYYTYKHYIKQNNEIKPEEQTQQLSNTDPADIPTEESNTSSIEPYTRDNFLSEVFM